MVCKQKRKTALSETALGGVLPIIALTAGAAITNVFYNQPMLDLIGAELRVRAHELGLISAATIFGYALGLIFLLPLGDRYDRKRLVLLQLVGVVVSLLAAARASSLSALLAASLGIGMSSTVAQQLVPLASSLAPPVARGRVVGSVVSAIMIGILLARSIAGFLSAAEGWRAVFYTASAAMAMVAALVAFRLPRSKPSTSLSYAGLLRSLLSLFVKHAVLRQAMLTQALLFGAFNAFWAALALLLKSGPDHLGSAAAGAFGLLGAGGACAAAVGGRLADRLGPRAVIGGCIVLVAASFAVFLGGTWSLLLLAVGVLTLDIGVQGALVANQTRVFALDPQAQNRINSLFTSSMFIGGAAGAAGATVAWSDGRWLAVCAFGAFLSSAAALTHWGMRRDDC